MRELPHDYAERVYAGVLGKLIGVYLGRPFEGWSHDAIEAAFGEVRAYVNDRAAGRPPVVVADDDISGTFTFLRALEDHGATPALRAEQIGRTWLNYLIEGKTILWWGGMGMSTEHTAYQRLKRGVPAPQSGSIALNGPVVAEQIGAQIFIDGWAMVAPGDPALAARLAREAASVSHDGEAIYAAQVVAAIEAMAFVESDIGQLIDRAVSLIPPNALIARLIADIRAWRRADDDWRATLRRIQARYGYERYGGNCHIVPNHALIILALLYCDGDFGRALMIACTAGYDTDCNAGNVGCIMGIRGGLAAIDAGPCDWRGPVADRLLLPTADGGRCITDAVQEAQRIVSLGHRLAGASPPPQTPRFSFAFPGSLQGFAVAEGEATLSNPGGGLAIAVRDNARVSTPTFLTADDLVDSAYSIVASPTLYPGQAVTALVTTETPLTANLFVAVYGADDRLAIADGPPMSLQPGAPATLQLTPDAAGGSPIAQVGLRIAGTGTLHVHGLDWGGAPRVALTMPSHNGALWRRAWVQACDSAAFGWASALRLMSDEEPGLLIQGEASWAGYTAQSTLTANLARSFGVAVCVQGLRRYYALLLAEGGLARLVKVRDERRRVLAEAVFPWELYSAYAFSLTTAGDRLIAAIDGQHLFDLRDEVQPFSGGAAALLVEAGRIDSDGLRLAPVMSDE